VGKDIFILIPLIGYAGLWLLGSAAFLVFFRLFHVALDLRHPIAMIRKVPAPLTVLTGESDAAPPATVTRGGMPGQPGTARSAALSVAWASPTRTEPDRHYRRHRDCGVVQLHRRRENRSSLPCLLGQRLIAECAPFSGGRTGAAERYITAYMGEHQFLTSSV
jgi:hypothetical protein